MTSSWGGEVPIKDKDAEKEYMRQYRKANKKRIRELQIVWEKKNPDKMRQYKREWEKRNPEKVAANNTGWREKNPDKVAANKKAWAKNNPEKIAGAAKRYRGGRTEIKLLLNAIKLVYGCVNPGCKWNGPFHSSMLDFHHVNRDEKRFSLGSTNTMSMDLLVNEINKCCVICSNCHREATWGKLDCSNFPRCHVSSDGTIV